MRTLWKMCAHQSGPSSSALSACCAANMLLINWLPFSLTRLDSMEPVELGKALDGVEWNIFIYLARILHASVC